MSISITSLGQRLSMDGRIQAARLGRAESPDVENVGRLEKTADASNSPVNLPQARKIFYNVNRDLNRVVVKIVDAKTDTVIEEIPSADMQKFIARFDAQIGLLLDKKV